MISALSARETLVPLAGLLIVALLIAGAALGVVLSDDERTTAGAVATPRPTATATVAASPAAQPTPTPAPSPTPADTAPLPRYSVEFWDGATWQSGPTLDVSPYAAGDVVPVFLRIGNALGLESYPVTIEYNCEAFQEITTYSLTGGQEPAMDRAGPGSAVPDATLDVGSGDLNAWRALFAGPAGLSAPDQCPAQLSLELVPVSDPVFLLWGVRLTDAGASGDIPMRLTVRLPSTTDPEATEVLTIGLNLDGP